MKICLFFVAFGLIICEAFIQNVFPKSTICCSNIALNIGCKSALKSNFAKPRRKMISIKMCTESSWLDKTLDRFLLNDKKLYKLGTRTEEEWNSQEDGMFCLIVYDDDVHSFQDFIKAFRASVRCSWSDSLVHVTIIQEKGKVLVLSSSLQDCEEVKTLLSKDNFECKILSVEEFKAQKNSPKGASKGSQPHASVWNKPFRNGARPTVAVIGGTGRVGMWTIRELYRFTGGDVDVIIGGRSEQAATRLIKQLRGDSATLGGREWFTMRTPQHGAAEFRRVALDDPQSLLDAMASADLGTSVLAAVIHTAGPFQGGEPQVLRAAIEAGVTYLDVCDDTAYAQACRALSPAARERGVSAATTCGIYPGVSSVMAAALARRLRAAGQLPEEVRFAYFTAGTGGVGATILASTFLLLAEPALTFLAGAPRPVPPLSLQRPIDFGSRIGTRRTMVLNLPEVTTLHEVEGVPTVSAYFGTAPEFWNVVLEAIPKLIPSSLLSNRKFARILALASLPINRLVDAFVGQQAAIRIDAIGGTSSVSALWSHPYLSQAVGTATAAMAMEMLEVDHGAGVFFPEEIIADESRTQVFLTRASRGARDVPTELIKQPLQS